MEARPLNLWSVALGRCVIQRQQQALAGHDHPHRGPQQGRRHAFDIASQAAEEVIIVLVIAPKLPAPQPTGHGPASLSKQGSGQQGQQSPSQAAMQQLGEVRDPNFHVGR